MNLAPGNSNDVPCFDCEAPCPQCRFRICFDCPPRNARKLVEKELARSGSLVFSLTLMPVLGSYFLRKVRYEEPWLIQKIKGIYLPWLERAMRRPARLTLTAVAVFLLEAVGAGFMGAEFIPRLDEGP